MLAEQCGRSPMSFSQDMWYTSNLMLENNSNYAYVKHKDICSQERFFCVNYFSQKKYLSQLRYHQLLWLYRFLVCHPFFFATEGGIKESESGIR